MSAETEHQSTGLRCAPGVCSPRLPGASLPSASVLCPRPHGHRGRTWSPEQGCDPDRVQKPGQSLLLVSHGHCLGRGSLWPSTVGRKCLNVRALPPPLPPPPPPASSCSRQPGEAPMGTLGSDAVKWEQVSDLRAPPFAGSPSPALLCPQLPLKDISGPRVSSTRLGPGLEPAGWLSSLTWLP